MPAPELTQLLSNGLQLLYGAHQQSSTQAGADAAGNENPLLKRAFGAEAKLHRDQSKRLDKVFKSVGLAPKGKPEAALQGIFDGSRERLDVTRDPLERALITIGYRQLAAHYYISAYGTLRNYAKALGHGEAVKLLSKTLDEMSTADKRLTSFANRIIAKTKADTGKKDSGSAVPGTLAIASLVGLGYVLLRKPAES